MLNFVFRSFRVSTTEHLSRLHFFAASYAYANDEATLKKLHGLEYSLFDPEVVGDENTSPLAHTAVARGHMKLAIRLIELFPQLGTMKNA